MDEPVATRSPRKWLMLALVAAALVAAGFFAAREVRPVPTAILPDGTLVRVSFGTRGVPRQQNWRPFPKFTDNYHFTSQAPDRWRWWKDSWNSGVAVLPKWAASKLTPYPKAVTNTWVAAQPYELLLEVTGGPTPWPWMVYAVDDSGGRALLKQVRNPTSARGVTMPPEWRAIAQAGSFPSRCRTLRLEFVAASSEIDASPVGPPVASLAIPNPFFESDNSDPATFRQTQPLGTGTMTLEAVMPHRDSITPPDAHTAFTLRFRENQTNAPSFGHRLAALSIQNSAGGWERVSIISEEVRPADRTQLILCHAPAWPSDGPWRILSWWFPRWTEANVPEPSFTFTRVPVPKPWQTLPVGQTAESGSIKLTMKSTYTAGPGDDLFPDWKPPIVTFWLSGWHPPTGKPFRAWRVRDSQGRTDDPATGLPYEMREIELDDQRGYRCAIKLADDVTSFDVSLTSAAPSLVPFDVVPEVTR